MISKPIKLLLVLALLFSLQVFAEDALSSTQPQSTEKSKHKLNTRAIYPNANISQNSEGKWVYSSKGRGAYDGKGNYYQDEFKTPHPFKVYRSEFSIEEMKGSHIPEVPLKMIEEYLEGLVEQCENIYDFDDSFYEASSVDKPFVEVNSICTKEDNTLCFSKLAHRIQRCVPYYRLKVSDFVRFSEEGNPLRLEYTNLEESYLLLKQYEIIYLTLRANQLMGKYSKLMIPMTLLQEYAKETGFYQYIQDLEPPAYGYGHFGDMSYEDYARRYFKNRENWQDEMKDFEGSGFSFSESRTDSSFGCSESTTGLGPGCNLEYLGLYEKLQLNNFTYSEKEGTHLSEKMLDEAYAQLLPMLNQCIEQSELEKDQLTFKHTYLPSSRYDRKLYPLLLRCTKNIPHYNRILSESWHTRKYPLFYEYNTSKKGIDFFPILIGTGIQDSIIDRTLLQQGSIIETELYPKIYLIIRHYRLLGRFPNAPIPTKLMDEYLDIHSNNVNRSGYGSMIGYLFDHQDSFAEFLDNKFNQLTPEK